MPYSAAHQSTRGWYQVEKNIIKKTMAYGLFRKLFYRCFRSTTKVELCDITKVFYTATPALYDRVLCFGGEKTFLEDFIADINGGETIWDVGAYIGMFGIFASCKTKSNGKVYCFEPEPKTNALLQKNCQLNNADNLTIFDCALFSEETKSYVYASMDDSLGIHSLAQDSRLAGKGTLVKLYPGDQLVESGKVDPPEVVKIDVEGAEFEVLKGMRKCLQTPQCRAIFIEVHPEYLGNFNTEPYEVKKIIIDSGFSILKETVRGDELHWICKK